MAGIESETIARLLAEHGPRLLLFAQTWSKNPSDAVQEVFVNLALRSNLPENPLAWLFGATRKRALHLARGEARLARRQHLASRPEATPSPGSLESDQKLDAETALQLLPNDLREIVIARLWGGLSFEEVGKLVNLPSATAWRRYDEALDLLKHHLAQGERP
jgi:RNA polymerase sigma-70 factor (ECF subfamily)